MQLRRDLRQNLDIVSDLGCRIYHFQFYDLSTEPSFSGERYVAITHPSLVMGFLMAVSREMCGVKPTITEMGETITVEGQDKRLTCYPIGQTIDAVVLPEHFLDIHVGANIAKELK